MKRFTVLLFCFLAAGSLLHAQQTTLSGQVKDSGGEPVPGAAIILTGTSEATIADIDGKGIAPVDFTVFNDPVMAPETGNGTALRDRSLSPPLEAKTSSSAKHRPFPRPCKERYRV